MKRRTYLLMLAIGVLTITSCGKESSLSREKTLEYVNQIMEYQNKEEFSFPNSFEIKSYTEETKSLKIGSKETVTGYISNATLIYDSDARYLSYIGDGEQNGVKSTFAYYLYKNDNKFIVATDSNGQKEYVEKTYSIMNGENTIINFLGQLLGDYTSTIKGQDFLSSIDIYFDSYSEENNTLDISIDGTTSNLFDVNKFEFLKEEDGHFAYNIEAVYAKDVDVNAKTNNTYIESVEIKNYLMNYYEIAFISENSNSTSSSTVLTKYVENYSYENIEFSYPNLEEFTLTNN